MTEWERWTHEAPPLRGTLDRDAAAAAPYYARGEELVRRLPRRPGRTAEEQATADRIHGRLRAFREAFLRLHAEAAYDALTGDKRRFVRVEDLVYAAAELFPGLVPTRAQVQAERALLQKDKDGVEVDQGIFLSHVLARPRPGHHLVHAMLRPKPESLGRLEAFARTGQADLGSARVERRGACAQVEIRNTRFLNAEDDAATAALETAVDLALLDPAVEVCVLRGAPVDHPRYAGRRIFQAGINLTHLYQGKISFVEFFMVRELGFASKMYRGLAGDDFAPGEPERTAEKPWIAAVEAFAIGGGCQLLLVMDRVLAEDGSYFNLPARKEGIIPGCANLRLPRVVGDRIARQGILFDRTFPAASPEGRMICDEVVPPGEMDAAIEATVAQLTGSGVVSAAGNRKALRVGQEPIDTFRAYMATYAREQALCHYSPALIRNLEANWNAHQRRG